MKLTRKELVGKVQTVLGVVSPDEMGIALTHEHVFCDESCSFTDPKEATARRIAREPVTFNNVSYIRYGHRNLDNLQLLDENLSISELMHYKHAGGETIVDATPIDLGRDPLGLKRVSLATGLNIVMGSGYYVKAAQNLSVMNKRTDEDIAEEIVKDIFEGVGVTGVHSGLIGEIGCSGPLEDEERKVLRAVGMAQKRTGAPLHIHPGRFEEAPTEIIKILKDVGTDLSHTAIDHIDRTLFEAKSRYDLAETGCFLEFDLWGVEGYYPEWVSTTDVPNDAQRIAIVKDLMARGYGKQILISHDIGEKSRYLCFGGHGFSHILVNAVPAMRRRGVSEEQINELLIENPKQFLAFR